MADGADLLRLQRSAHPDHDGRRRLRLLAREQLPLRQHEVDADRLNPVDRLDGAGKLALQRAQVVDVLHEAGRAQRVGFVEDFVADAAALGQAALGEFHPQLGDAILRHQDHGAVVLHLIGDGLMVEFLDDGGGIFIAEVGIKGDHLRRGDAHDDECEKPQQRHGDGHHGRHARRTQTSKECHQSLQRTRPRFGPKCRLGRICLGMVSIWLTPVNGRVHSVNLVSVWGSGCEAFDSIWSGLPMHQAAAKRRKPASQDETGFRANSLR